MTYRLAISMAAIIMAFNVCPVSAQFVPGHIFVEEAQIEGCFEGHAHHGRIWEIDPDSGEATLFFDAPEELCGGINHLLFTPDGTRLLVSSLPNNRIFEFDSEGNYQTAYDGRDGLWGPISMAFDAQGNLFVSNRFFQNIIKLPADGGPFEIFAGTSNGIWNTTGIAVASTGDLFVGVNVAPGPVPNRLLRFTAARQGEVFDEYGFIDSVEALIGDRFGNVFVKVSNWFYRYRIDAPASKELFSPEAFGRIDQMLISPDETQLLTAAGLWTWTIDLQGGAIEQLFFVPGETLMGGIAVAPVRVGDLNRNGSIDLNDFAVFQRCFQSLCGKLIEPQIAGNAVSELCLSFQLRADSELQETCAPADLTKDRRIDLSDYAAFRTLMEGP